MRILIVDDSDTSRLLLTTILKGEGYDDLVTSATARQALDYLQGPEGRSVDLVLMDIVMPGMNGIEATQAIKAMPAYADVPIIMVTVRDEEDSLAKAFEVGATDYINKPVSRIELRARVRSVLRLKEEMDRRKAREAELEELTRELQELSNLDGLTQVANRRSFDDVLVKEWLRARRAVAPLSLLMIDIDHFKLYNDTYGHLRGDACLKRVAEAIRMECKRPGDFPARFGGEEFAVILPGTDTDGALAIAQAIRGNMAHAAMEHAPSPTGEYVTVSIGVAGVVPEDEAGHRRLIAEADAALYLAKAEGRDRIVTAPRD